MDCGERSECSRTRLCSFDAHSATSHYGGNVVDRVPRHDWVLVTASVVTGASLGPDYNKHSLALLRHGR